MTATGTGASPSLLPIAALVAERAGLSFLPHGSEGLARASRRVMARYALEDFEQLHTRLYMDPVCFGSLLDEVTVGETYFFRNPEHFELVRTRLLPALIHVRGERHLLQVWSAGCATGEEAYSLAMLLDREGLLERSRVLGTDIAPGALEKARAGCYREWSLRGLDPAIRERWLRADEGQVRVCEPIRRSVMFRQLNLAEPCYPSTDSGVAALDLIFCRNVLIYFDAPTICAVEQRLFAALAPGGWLVAGPSDPLLGKYAGFEVHVTEQGICYRRPPTPGLKDIAAELAAATDAAAAAPPLFVQPALAIQAPVDEVGTAVPDDPSANERAAGSVPEEIRAIWRSQGSQAGLLACERALQRDALSVELHYLHALLLLDLGRDPQALEAVRRTLYLDSGLAIAQFTLGTILERAGRPHAARRPYRNAYDAASLRPCDEPVRLADDLRAGALAAAAAGALARLGDR